MLLFRSRKGIEPRREQLMQPRKEQSREPRSEPSREPHREPKSGMRPYYGLSSIRSQMTLTTRNTHLDQSTHIRDTHCLPQAPLPCLSMGPWPTYPRSQWLHLASGVDPLQLHQTILWSSDNLMRFDIRPYYGLVIIWCDLISDHTMVW